MRANYRSEAAKSLLSALPKLVNKNPSNHSIIKNQEDFTRIVGDWHTHPNGEVYVSDTDRRTLRRIATYKQARLTIPLMAVIEGVFDWVINFWCYEPTRLGNFGIRIKAKKLKIKLY